MRDISKMMQQAKKIQERAAKLQDDLRAERIEATAGGGVVRAVTNGHGELLEVTIDPSAVDPADVSMLQDLVVAAVSEAQRSAKELSAQRMKELAGGLGLPPGLV